MNPAHLSVTGAAAAGQHEAGGAGLVQSVQAEERLDLLRVRPPTVHQQGLQLLHRPQLVQDVAALGTHTHTQLIYFDTRTAVVCAG